MASERTQRAQEHPQSGQQAAGRDLSSPLRLPTAQLHQQPLERLRLDVVLALQVYLKAGIVTSFTKSPISGIDCSESTIQG